MQGNHPLPERIIQKFAKTGGELCKDVFLMSESVTYQPLDMLKREKTSLVS